MRLGKSFLALVCVSMLLPARPATADAMAGYDTLLHRHVHDGVVDYRALAEPASRRALVAYLTEVASARLPANHQERLAAWINAYNALALESVLNGGSPNTVWGRYLFFRQAKHQVFGRELSLEAIENEVIRKEFAEPRIHFALVCASRSCPPLRHEAYVATRLDAQLDDQGVRFLGDTTKNRLERVGKVLYLSKIFEWYANDFERAAGSVPLYIASFAPPTERDWISRPGVTIRYLDYDWRLNGTR